VRAMCSDHVHSGYVCAVLIMRQPSLIEGALGWQGLTETGAVGVAYPVLQALSFMHQLSLMHRDVKVLGEPVHPRHDLLS